MYDYEQVIDETFNAKSSGAAKGGTCEHMDMCPIATTAKVKRRCQERRGSSDMPWDTRPCRSEEGFWGCIRKLLGLNVRLLLSTEASVLLLCIHQSAHVLTLPLLSRMNQTA